ncbi:MAG: KH domain-containing protein [Patescibacteria group bacterium]|nr:KH domain-containing protein [Patescibacteria group bacterium]
MKTILENIIKSVVKNPKDITVEQEDINDLAKLKVTANKEDMGTIIGKQGRVIKAIRELVKVKALKQNKYFEIQVLEK